MHWNNITRLCNNPDLQHQLHKMEKTCSQNIIARVKQWTRKIKMDFKCVVPDWLKLTASYLITIVSTVITPITPVSIVDTPPISACEFPEVARPKRWCGNICSRGWCSSWKKEKENRNVNVNCNLGRHNPITLLINGFLCTVSPVKHSQEIARSPHVAFYQH